MHDWLAASSTTSWSLWRSSPQSSSSVTQSILRPSDGVNSSPAPNVWCNRSVNSCKARNFVSWIELFGKHAQDKILPYNLRFSIEFCYKQTSQLTLWIYIDYKVHLPVQQYTCCINWAPNQANDAASHQAGWAGRRTPCTASWMQTSSSYRRFSHAGRSAISWQLYCSMPAAQTSTISSAK